MGNDTIDSHTSRKIVKLSKLTSSLCHTKMFTLAAVTLMIKTQALTSAIHFPWAPSKNEIEIWNSSSVEHNSKDNYFHKSFQNADGTLNYLSYQKSTDFFQISLDIIRDIKVGNKIRG